MSPTAKKEDIFKSSYTQGEHIKDREYIVELPGTDSIWTITASSLFLPLHDHQAAEKIYPMPKKVSMKYTLPNGGDLFLMNINGHVVNLFAMDIAGHGFLIHKLAQMLAGYAFSHRTDSNLASSIGHHWMENREKILSEHEVELALLKEELIRKGFKDTAQVNRLLNLMRSKASDALLESCQASVDLSNRKITISTFGTPAVYLFYMNKPLGKIVIGQNIMFGVDELVSQSIRNKEFPINDTDEFRLVLFTDAFIDQDVDIDSSHGREFGRLSSGIDSQSRISQSANKNRNQRYSFLLNFMRDLIHVPPSKFTRQFYDYFVRLNRRPQKDDITLVVADFKKSPIWK